MIVSEEPNKKTTGHYDLLLEILGKNYINCTIESSFDFISIASKGIDAHVISNFREHFSIPRGYAAELLNISQPTIYRWIKSNKKLDRNYSVQLFELTDLFLFGTEVFESKENFFKWLELPNAAFGGLEPKGLLDIPGGISKVRDLLGRIEYGVYSQFMIVYRITKRKRAADISGTGAALYSGRWNKKGTPVLYTGKSESIALLENIVHMPAGMTPKLDLLTIEIPDNSILELKAKELPSNWKQFPAPTVLTEIGQKWIDEGKTLALKVPSSIIESASNYILNCTHTDFQLMKIIDRREFHFDARLIK